MFASARLRLTLWYLAILGAIVGLLSLILYRTLVSLQNAELRAVSPTTRHDIAQLFSRDEGTLISQILALDAGVLILAAVGAYVLAGRTLDPIAQALERQQRFAASASHELRTPLTVLQGRLEVALLRRREPEEYEQVVREAAGEAKRLGVLVADLLALARMQRDAEALSLDLLDLREVVREVAENRRPLANEKNLVLTVELHRALLVQGDAVKLRQAVSTLVDNAVAYTPDGGSILISGSKRRNGAAVQVRDSGPGIAPEHLSRIFEPFYRVSATTRTGNDGHAGLGLALAAWVVRAHGGHLTVESHLGSGSVFTILLPEAT
jgi:signal transduction histidine kinase